MSKRECAKLRKREALYASSSANAKLFMTLIHT